MEEQPQAPDYKPPPPVTVTESEALQFVYDGRGHMAALAVAARNLVEWADTFEQRGGTPIYGDDALAMVYLSNDLQAWLTPDRRALLAKMRTDI